MSEGMRQIKQFWSKYIRSISLVLNWAFGISVFIVISHLINSIFLHIPEWFPGGNEVQEFFYDSSLALISAYVFYFIVTHLKRQQDKGQLLPLLSSKTDSIIGAAETVAGHLAQTSGHKFEGHLPSSADTKTMCSKVQASEKISWTYTPGSGMNVRAIQTHLEYLVFHMERTRVAIRDIYVVMAYLEAEHVRLLATIDDCHYFNTLAELKGADLGTKELSFLAVTLYQYFEHVEALFVYKQSRGNIAW